MLPSDLTEGEIASRLADASRLSLPPDPAFQITFPPGWHKGLPRPAAVLVPFLNFAGEWHILFTRRTDTLPEHSGQVAFPRRARQTLKTGLLRRQPYVRPKKRLGYLLRKSTRWAGWLRSSP